MGLNNDKATRHLSSLEKEYENYLEYPLNLNITRGILVKNNYNYLKKCWECLMIQKIF